MAGPGRKHFTKEKPKDLKKSIKRLFGFIIQFKSILIPLLISVLIYTICSLTANVFMEKVFSALGTYDIDKNIWTKAPDSKEFYKYLFILISLYVGYVITRCVNDLLNAKLSTRIIKKFRKSVFDKLVRLPISYTDTHQHGDLMSRTVNDVETISTAINASTTSLIGGVITIVGCFGIMLYYSPLLTLVCLGVLIISLLSTSSIARIMEPLHKKSHKILGQLNSQTEEMVTGSKTVIAYNRQDKAIEEFSKKSDEIMKVSTKAEIISGSMGPMMNFVGNLGYFAVCIFGAIFAYKHTGNGIFGKELTIPVIITFLHLVKQFNRPINEVAQVASQLVSAVAASERVFEILDEKEEDFTGKAGFDPSMIKGVIDFNHIGFSYVKGTVVLNDFNVDVWSGHKIALVGATGSGKTTIVNLLLRFYDIDTGKITIDNIDIKDISKKDLRSCISIVLQDPILFQDSIENNIRYAKEDATDEEIDNALEFANCKKFVNRLVDGKKTILTEGATNISQGQRQLLTIARAVLANPKILILDEATSSVDTRTEKKIQDAMSKLMENRTSIIIAHRLSTIQDADLIVVLDKGRVVEMGDHKQLIEKDGVYNKLYQTQFQGNEI